MLKSAQVSGLAKELSHALSPWRPARSVHDPGKTVLNLAVTIALGGDCLADAAVIRAQPELFGAVASDPTISRLIDTLGEDSAAVITAIRGARAAARATVWGHRSPVPRADPVIIDLDATLITAHSEKEGATPNFKHGFGFHPLLAFVDHGDGGTGEPLVGMLRPGRANANTAADQIAVLDAALAQLPEPLRSRVLVRGDSGSGVQPLLWHVHDLGLAYSVGFSARQPVQDALAALPKQAWRAALRSRRPAPRRRPSRRADSVDAAHLDRVAARDAHHRPPRTSPSWRPVAHHRRRRLAHHRVRHQHRRRAASPIWRCATDCVLAPKTASVDSRTPG